MDEHDREDRDSMADKASRERMLRAVRDAIPQVEKQLLAMALGPCEGTILIEMLGTRGQVRVKPTPFLVYDGGTGGTAA